MSKIQRPATKRRRSRREQTLNPTLRSPRPSSSAGFCPSCCSRVEKQPRLPPSPGGPEPRGNSIATEAQPRDRRRKPPVGVRRGVARGPMAFRAPPRRTRGSERSMIRRMKINVFSARALPGAASKGEPLSTLANFHWRMPGFAWSLRRALLKLAY